jgi:hypothetical protein
MPGCIAAQSRDAQVEGSCRLRSFGIGGVDTTAHYAKADVNLLQQIAQPWPEAL